MTQQPKRNHSYHKGHAALFYATLAQRLQFLGNYFSDGLDHGELCIFATPGPESQAIEDFDSVGLNIRPAVDEGRFKIFGMYDTYLPDGTFRPQTMLSNVASFIRDSQSKGFAGLRTAGEMRWVNVYPDWLDALAQYEDDVNQLDSDHSFMGLCLYPLMSESTPILKAALDTHPAFIYDGKMSLNPYTPDGELRQTPIPEDVTKFTELLAFA